MKHMCLFPPGNCCRANQTDLTIQSAGGGTDIISCFMGQNHTVPVYRGEIQARNLGMAVEAWSPEGQDLL
ncbi:acetoacetyl-CoA synthetase isoform X1 [Tachysurus ichikawai]